MFPCRFSNHQQRQYCTVETINSKVQNRKENSNSHHLPKYTFPASGAT